MAKQLLQTDKRTIQFQSSDKFRLTQTADLFKEHDLEAVLTNLTFCSFKRHEKRLVPSQELVQS